MNNYDLSWSIQKYPYSHFNLMYNNLFTYIFPANTEDKEQRMLKELLNPKQVIFNNETTVVVWQDGSKTIVNRSGDDKFTEEVGVAMCYMKKLFGDRSKFLKLVEKAYRQPERKHKTSSVSE